MKASRVSEPSEYIINLGDRYITIYIYIYIHYYVLNVNINIL